MDINPFIIAGKVPSEYFCDRVEETKRLTGCIMNQENVVLISPRRMGKTELINHCFEDNRIQKEMITISVDILQTTSLNEFVQTIGKAVYKQVASKSSNLMKKFGSTLKSLAASFGYDPITATPTFDIKIGDIKSPQYTLEEIFEYLNNAGKRCIVAIDEFQQIIYYPEKNIEAILRQHIQKCTNANFIFSGSNRRMMREMFKSENRPFYQSATLMELGAMNLDVYTEFVKKHFKDDGKKIDSSIVEYVYKTFSGVSLYIQRISHDIYAEIKPGDECNIDLAKYMIDRYIAENNIRFREQLSLLGDSQKALLYAICEDKVAKEITSSDFISRHRLKSASSVQAATKKLLEYDFITKGEDGSYSLSDPMLQLWLERN